MPNSGQVQGQSPGQMQMPNSGVSAVAESVGVQGQAQGGPMTLQGAPGVATTATLAAGLKLSQNDVNAPATANSNSNSQADPGPAAAVEVHQAMISAHLTTSRSRVPHRGLS